MKLKIRVSVGEDNKRTLLLYKDESLGKLLERVKNVVKFSFSDVEVIDMKKYVSISSDSNQVIFLTSLTYLEEALERFLGHFPSENIDFSFL